MSISLYWKNRGKTEADRKPGRTFERSDGLGCNECCTKLYFCEPEDHHFHRDSCPYCLGTGQNASCFTEQANAK